MKFIEIVKMDLRILKEASMNHLEEYHYPSEDFEYFTYLDRSLTSELINETIFKNKEDKHYLERIELFKNNFLKSNEEEFNNTNLLWIRVEHYHWFNIDDFLKYRYQYLLNEDVNLVLFFFIVFLYISSP